MTPQTTTTQPKLTAADRVKLEAIRQRAQARREQLARNAEIRRGAMQAAEQGGQTNG